MKHRGRNNHASSICIAASLSAFVALAPARQAAGYAGDSGILLMDGLPSDLVFREGVAETKTVWITTRVLDSSQLCHGEVAGQFTLAGPFSAVSTCYGGDADGSTTNYGDAHDCLPNVGSSGARYSLGGGGFVRRGFPAKTFPLRIRYNGAPVTTRSSMWKLVSDGLCSDVHPAIFRDAGAVNLYVLPSATTFTSNFVATASSSLSSTLELNHPLLNDQPDARPLVTAMAEGGARVVKHYGVRYNTVTRRWMVYHEDNSAIASGRRFQVAIGGARSFVHTTTSGLFGSNVSRINHPFLNHNPNAHLIVTHAFNPPGAPSNTFNRAFGVWYDASAGRWSIYAEDRAAMPAGITFHVLAASSRGNEINRWSTISTSMSATGTYFISHEYSVGRPRYLDSPVSFLVETLLCHPLYGCAVNVGPGTATGLASNDNEFVVWSPLSPL